MNIPNTLIYAVDTKYCYTSFSKQYIQNINEDYNVEPTIGMNILDVVKTEEHKRKLEDNLKRSLQKEYHSDYEIHGTSVVEIKYSPIIDESKNVIGVIAIKNVMINNYSKWFKHFSDLKIFESITNVIKAGIVLVDTNKIDMPIVFVNDAFVKMTGYTKEEVIGRNCRFLQGDLQNQAPKNNLRQAIKENKSCEIEIKNFTKEGAPFYNLLNITPLFDDKGKLIYYMGMQFDITNSVEYRKVTTIKRLSEGLTHEINTAMAPLKGHMEMLQYDVEAIDDEKSKEYMLDSLQSIQKSKKIIEEISSSLHYFSSTQKDQLEEVNILDTIHTSILEHKDKIDSNKIILQIKSADDITLHSEKDALVHLWMILLDNSIDALIETGTSKNINITVTKLSTHIQVTFADNAKGINPAIQEDIFKALTKSKEYGGKGIGLFVAKVIVENHNGDISFTTSKEGTKFKIILKS
jgi:PAS domain S-box-containing protein